MCRGKKTHYLINERVDLIRGRGQRGGLVHAVLHIGGLNVQVLELLLEFIHHRRDLLCVHALQCAVHAAHNARHRLSDLWGAVM